MSHSSAKELSRRARWRRFMSGGAAERFLFLIRCAPWPPERPMPMPHLMKEREEWALASYEWQLSQTEWLEDDTLPFLDCLTGTDIFAEAFGAPVSQPDGGMPYAEPIVFSSRDLARLKAPTLDSPPFARMLELLDRLQARAGKEALVRTVDVQSPMDIVALLWDKTDLFVAMLDEPEAVKDAAAFVAEGMTLFLDEWFRRVGREHIAHFPEYFMDGGLTLSEDEIGSVSPEAFDEFFLPELNALSDRYGGLGMHCCAHARHQWGGFKKVKGLRLLNLCQPRETCLDAYREFGGSIVHWHGWHGDGSPESHPGQIPPGCRFVMEAWCEDRDEALRLAESLESQRA